MGGSSLTQLTRLEGDLDTYLRASARVFREFRDQDSGCISFGVEQAGRRLFVKHSSEDRGVASLKRAEHLNSVFRHPCLPALHNSFTTPGGLALVYDWVDGASVRDWEPGSGSERFRSLPVTEAVPAIDNLFDLHVKLIDAGFIAVDLYDGCFLYDFDRRHLWVYDLDEYHVGPFTLEADRLPGSTRFMAPEEFVRGSTIDQVTNVYVLGRCALILLGDKHGTPAAFRGGDALKAVALKASSPDRVQRYQSVRGLADAWRASR